MSGSSNLQADDVTVGARVRSRRLECGLQMNHLASRVGISRTFLKNIEAGKITPEAAILNRIALALDTTTEALCEEGQMSLGSSRSNNTPLSATQVGRSARLSSP